MTDAYANLQHVLTRPINWELLRQQYDQSFYAAQLHIQLRKKEIDNKAVEMRKCTRVHKIHLPVVTVCCQYGESIGAERFVHPRMKGGDNCVVTRKEVAQLAGVSEATVSRVFNGLGPMKNGTKELVLKAAKELDYHPNAIAQSFARRRSGNLGVVLPFTPKVHLFSTYYFSETLSGIGEQARMKGYDILLLLQSPDETIDYARLYRSQKVDACVILGSMDTQAHRQSLQQLRELKLPFCLVNQHFQGLDFNEIDADHVQGSYLAVRNLQEWGYSRIAFLNGSSPYSNSRDRLEGYQKAMSEAGLSIDEKLLFEGNYSRKSGFTAAAEIWERRTSIEAVFAANDRMAIGLLQGLHERGWIAGRDYALIGCDDSDAAKLSSPPLSSVYVPFYDMGKRAASVALEQAISGDKIQITQEKLPTRLIIRESSSKNK